MHEDQVMDTVEELARLQARYWNNDALEKLVWMPTTNRIGFDYVQKWDSFVKHFGQYVDQSGLEVGERVGRFISWIEKKVDGRPKTIVHNDLREDNLLFGRPHSDDAVLIVDWQLAVRSMGAFDVARLIGGSELPAERKGHQFEVLRRWFDTLVREGVTNYTWEDAVYDLRLGSLACLCYPVHFHVGVVGSKGRSMELTKVICRRLFSSVIEIEAASVLPNS
jgi:thiamine kinase-like enzyme